jgi:Lrp/AsnC family leucine-responsive transcriptional regulator
MSFTMDALDRKALAFLKQRGRATWAQLGQLLGLSPPAAAERVHRLEEKGIVRGYTALLNAEALGYPLLAFVLVTLTSHRKRLGFLKAIQGIDEISECHHIAGEGDYLLKVRCRGTHDLDRILVRELKDKLGVAHTRATIVLSTAKESVSVPINNRQRSASDMVGSGF